ncbi:hypothetical protein [Flavobacterium sp. KBS0721]|uniref:hypothetical protein n=1 Tax=Flavobacterium sp. KBS0721 TaxID=1179672 RepID=UPI00098F9363|nr:hypothetical protein [Flavobacterium sp. KBS0721]QDW21114.1 hypothetical protein B0M43_0013660 [Flavobacterium sp. KBS0721]
MTPLKGPQTDRNTQKSNEAENDSFETIEPEKDNRVQREFEIEEIENDELQEDELTRDETRRGVHNNKHSQRKF